MKSKRRVQIYPRGGKVDFLIQHFKSCPSCEDGKALHVYYDSLTQFGRDALVWPARMRDRTAKLSNGAKALVFASWVALIAHRTSLLTPKERRDTRYFAGAGPKNQIQFKRPSVKRNSTSKSIAIQSPVDLALTYAGLGVN